MMNRDRGSNPKLTLLPFLITAMARALARLADAQRDLRRRRQRHHPPRRAPPRHGDADAERADGRRSSATPRRKSVWQLAREILRLAEAARTGKATREELSGSIDHHLEPRPDGRHHLDPGDQPARGRDHRGQQGRGEGRRRRRRDRGPQAHEPVAVSCDHRVVDGWDAASFMQALKGYIENPLRLLSRLSVERRDSSAGSRSV